MGNGERRTHRSASLPYVRRFNHAIHLAAAAASEKRCHAPAVDDRTVGKDRRGKRIAVCGKKEFGGIHRASFSAVTSALNFASVRRFC